MKNYYLILGVGRQDSSTAIRARYRDLARERHPDFAGEDSTPAFQEINEAYQVLSDTGRRRQHNEQLDRNRDRRREFVEPLVPVQPEPEPLVREPISFLSQPESVHPSFDGMVERFRRNFTGVSVPKAERLQTMSVEVLLSPWLAQTGTTLPIGIPVFRTCPTCAGSGRDWLFPCLHCFENGVVQDEAVIHVPIPPSTHQDQVIDIPLQGLGIHNFVLRLHVRVE